MIRRIVLCGALIGSTVVAGLAQQSSVANLKTTAEASDFKSTSTHAEVVAFMKAVAAAAPNLIHYTTYGKTFEGREMPMAVVGKGLKDASAASVLATGRLRVHIQGNIHAGEVEGKESAQILLREIAMGQHADWLDSMVLLVTPIFNADGNERMSPDNRGRQNGPINGMGTRANAQNLNINRDFMKLETPEARAFVKLWIDYDPQVGFDLHTSNGSNHAYHLTYSPPLHPNTNDAIMNLMKAEWFPFITDQVKRKHGWDMFYYGNASGGGGGRGGRGRGEAAGRQGGAGATPQTSQAPAAPAAPGIRAWGTFEHVPRFHNNYVGLRNRFALLSEAYSYATFADRIRATNYFVDEALTFAHTHAERLKQMVAAADAETLAGRAQATRAAIRTAGLIQILMGEVEPETNPVNNAQMNRRVNVSKPEMMLDRLWFSPTWHEDVPAAYYVPANAAKALELLRAHGVRMREAKAPTSGLEQFVITGNTTRAGRGGGGPSIDTGTHELRTIQGYWQAASATLPAGAWEVPMDQPLARLAFILLAPTSDDGVLTWNFLDDLLAANDKSYPILRRRQ
jgi:hypothetical protein